MDPCNGQTNVIFSTSGIYSNYLWSNGTTSQTNVVTQPGIYSITATDANGCLTQDSVDVTITGTNLYGTVTTSTGAALANSQIIIYDNSGPAPVQLQLDTTDASGVFFAAVPTYASLLVQVVPSPIDFPGEAPTYYTADLLAMSAQTVQTTDVVDTLQWATLGSANIPGVWGRVSSYQGELMPGSQALLLEHDAGTDSP